MRRNTTRSSAHSTRTPKSTKAPSPCRVSPSSSWCWQSCSPLTAVRFACEMGAKASTANGDDNGTSHGDRSYSSGNGGPDSVQTAGNPAFSILRSLPSVVANDRQRARSLSSVPDGHDPNSNNASPRFDITEVLEADSSSNDDQTIDSPTVTANISLGRVYSAHSLPAHIWPFNGMRVVHLLFYNVYQIIRLH